MNDHSRPSPDALLRAAKREGRGRLKVFLGAAPGVGKTYEMLSSGNERARAGIDVVIGLIETHGRAETEAMVSGYGIIPRRKVVVQGRLLDEMDLDAILARRPQLVLVDELAHTNVPGSRHPKRYQDIAELLDAGIDVYTTVNIQHIESLNDVVASFSRVRVRETVPDSVLEDADLEVVDLPPDELIERLKAGKVYVPQEASRALQHFFSKTNLSALRELALRRGAQAADAETQEQVLLSPGQTGAPTAERVVVAISAVEDSAHLVRAGKRLADALRAPWSTLHIETAQDQHISAEARAQLNAALQLAAQLGGETVSLPARTIAEGMVTALKDARATHLVMGTRRPRRNWGFAQPRLVEYVVRQNEQVTVHLVPNVKTTAHQRRYLKPIASSENTLWHFAVTLMMVAAVTGIGIAVAGLATMTNIALFYLVPVVAAAMLFGLRPGLFAGLSSALAYNFFFIPPIYTFTINNPQNLLTLTVFVGVAIVIAQLAHRVRIQADLAMASARTNAALAGFARRLTSVADQQTLTGNICGEVARLLDVQAIIVRRDIDGTHIVASNPPTTTLNPLDSAAAQWVIDTGKAAGRGSDTLTASDYLFQPLGNEPGQRLALGLGRSDGALAISADRVALLASLVDQSTLAFDRVTLGEEMAVLSRLEERDQLRAALLNSVSHDLRTPLTTILATAQSLKCENLGNAANVQVTTIESEAIKLNRFIANLLDMSRIEAGSIKLTLEPVDLIDAIATAVHDLKIILDENNVRVDIPANLPLVQLDPHLFHHILINILENAAKYGQKDTVIAVTSRRTLDGLILDISNAGGALADGDAERMFDVFTRLSDSDRAGGTGLGLAIVKGFATAMGLKVSVLNRTDADGVILRLIAPPQLLVTPDRTLGST